MTMDARPTENAQHAQQRGQHCGCIGPSMLSVHAELWGPCNSVLMSSLPCEAHLQVKQDYPKSPQASISANASTETSSVQAHALIAH